MPGAHRRDTVCVCDIECECELMVWVWLGPVWTWLKSPSLKPSVAAGPDCALPMGKRPRMSGRLNVVEPLPGPNVVPIAVNSAEYVERLMAAPSQNSQLVGAVIPPNGMMHPAGTLSVVVVPPPLPPPPAAGGACVAPTCTLSCV